MTLKVYKMKNGVEKNWDDIDFETEIEMISTFEGETNEECEAKAVENGYGDTDIYGWSYVETI